MESRIQDDIKYLKKSLENHKGKWLDKEGVMKYQEFANRLHSMTSENIDKRRELGLQMMEEYGVTELEAINILNDRWVNDYIAKYERIRTQTPLSIKDNRDSKDDEEEFF